MIEIQWMVTWRHGGAYGPFPSALAAAKWALKHSAMGWYISPLFPPFEEEKKK
jgi:hypothetical protein